MRMHHGGAPFLLPEDVRGARSFRADSAAWAETRLLCSAAAKPASNEDVLFHYGPRWIIQCVGCPIYIPPRPVQSVQSDSQFPDERRCSCGSASRGLGGLAAFGTCRRPSFAYRRTRQRALLAYVRSTADDRSCPRALLPLDLMGPACCRLPAARFLFALEFFRYSRSFCERRRLAQFAPFKLSRCAVFTVPIVRVVGEQAESCGA